MKNKKFKSLALGLGTVATIAAPIAAVVSCGSSNGAADVDAGIYKQGRRTLVEYTPESSFAGERNRAWDMTAQAKSPNSRTIYDMSMTTLFSQRVTQSSKVVLDGNGNEDPKQTQEKKSHWILDGAASLTFKDAADQDVTVKDGEDAMSKIPTKGVKEFSFQVPANTFYVDSEGKKTKYQYRAEDYLYGFLRSLYTSEDAREKGTIKGIKTGAPIMEASYSQKIRDDEEWYPGGKLDADNFDNANVYLLNLFGVDIAGTIAANTGASHKVDDPFVLKLKKATHSTAFISAILANTNLFTPAPAAKIRELSGTAVNAAFTNPGHFLQLLEFGKATRTNGVADLSGELSVAKYYISQYDTRSVRDGGTGVVLEKNEFGANDDYAKKATTLKKYVSLVHGKGDEDTFALARQKSFLEDNSESVLYSTVQSSPSLMTSIKGKYTDNFKSSVTGTVSQGIMNPYYMVNGKQKLDDNTSLLLFGEKTGDVKDSPTADDEYFFGRGRTLRTLLNTSVNLYSFSKFISPERTKLKTARNFEADSPISTTTSYTFGSLASSKLGQSINSLTDEEASNWYTSHSDVDEGLKPTDAQYKKAQDGWKSFLADAVANQPGLNANSKFVFPLYDYRASDVTEKATQTNAFNKIVEYLNTLTKGTNISFVAFDKNSGDKETNIINKMDTAPFVYSGAGADYPSVASLLQQQISASYGYTIGAELLAKALDGTDGLKDISDLYGEGDAFEASGLKQFIVDGATDFPLLSAADVETKLKAITLNDWLEYRMSSLDTKDTVQAGKKALLDEIDNMFQQYFLSIAGEGAEIKKWITLLSNVNMGDKLALGYESYSSLATPILGKTPIGTAYSQPWVHLAQRPSASQVQANYVDLTIDPEPTN